MCKLTAEGIEGSLCSRYDCISTVCVININEHKQIRGHHSRVKRALIVFRSAFIISAPNEKAHAPECDAYIVSCLLMSRPLTYTHRRYYKRPSPLYE